MPRLRPHLDIQIASTDKHRLSCWEMPSSPFSPCNYAHSPCVCIGCLQNNWNKMIKYQCPKCSLVVEIDSPLIGDVPIGDVTTTYYAYHHLWCPTCVVHNMHPIEVLPVAVTAEIKWLNTNAQTVTALNWASLRTVASLINFIILYALTALSHFIAGK